MTTNGSVSFHHRVVTSAQWGITAYILAVALAGIFAVLLPNGVSRTILLLVPATGILLGFAWNDISKPTDVDKTVDQRIEYVSVLLSSFVIEIYLLVPFLQTIVGERLHMIYISRSLSMGFLIGLVFPIVVSYVIAYHYELRIFGRLLR